MYFERRGYNPSPVSTAEALAIKLTQCNWTGCTAFSFGGFIFLNDASCEDGAGEWAIITTINGRQVQVESVTFGWMSTEEALDYLLNKLPGLTSVQPMLKLVTIHPHPEGSCHLCA
jgi:hypothetical protein